MYYDDYKTKRIFAEQELSQYLDSKKTLIINSIENENNDYLLNVNESDYIAHKISQAEVDLIEIKEDELYVSSEERMIPAECFPRSFYVHSGKAYKKDVIKFYVPFNGNRDLLLCTPSTRIVWSMNVEINQDEFCFEIINFSDDTDAILREKDNYLKSIIQQCQYVNKDVSNYNSHLETLITNAFNTRKEKIIKKEGVLASLGIPIKKSTSTPDTFAVSTIKKKTKPIILKPEVNESGYTPEPSLDNSVYQSILKIIHDTGKEFERLPSVYANKEEEHLRDHFLMILEPNFEGSATGETFNKSGKTDILLRYENSNVFIGECKFWRGKSSFLKTIDQLLGYLTWRDSKAAVIMFVPNKEFTSVINIAKNSVTEHTNFLKVNNEQDETWLNCEFHLNGDRNRIVKVAIMLYHTPRI